MAKKPRIRETPLQQALTEYVGAADYCFPVPKIGELNEEQLKQFDKFFTQVTDELGKKIYYVGCEDGVHTFTNYKGWMQYHLYIRSETKVA